MSLDLTPHLGGEARFGVVHTRSLSQGVQEVSAKR